MNVYLYCTSRDASRSCIARTFGHCEDCGLREDQSDSYDLMEIQPTPCLYHSFDTDAILLVNHRQLILSHLHTPMQNRHSNLKLPSLPLRECPTRDERFTATDKAARVSTIR
jgi:hypothetical protein